MNSGFAFLKDETGAVTVDFVVLTAAVVVMAMLILPSLRDSVTNMAIFIGEQVTSAEDYLE